MRSRSFDSLPRRLAQGPLLTLLYLPNWNSHSGKRRVLPGKSRQIMLFTPCNIMSIKREILKILTRCQEPGSRDLIVAIFPSGGSGCMLDSRNSLFMMKQLAYRTHSSGLVATLFKGLVRQCLEYVALSENPVFSGIFFLSKERSYLSLG